jgi:hypothetical protein
MDGIIINLDDDKKGFTDQPPVAKLIIHVEGGLIQSISSTSPVSVVLVDTDIDSYTDDAKTRLEIDLDSLKDEEGNIALEPDYKEAKQELVWYVEKMLKRFAE